MPNSRKSKTDTWRWIFIGLLVAAVALGVLYYIGWFDRNTHVDTPAGDNVEAVYAPSGHESQAESDWQNADHESLREVIVDETPNPAE